MPDHGPVSRRWDERTSCRYPGLQPGAQTGVRIASFDTRISNADAKSALLSFLLKIFGYAAVPLSARLLKKGGAKVLQPEGFFVMGSCGPLKDGEINCAARWVATRV
jgi:hypothetical protein